MPFSLEIFHPIVREWFTTRFQQPTPAQEQGWPAIAQGRHTLIAAPTGSGKTLAAFLICLDKLIRSAAAGTLQDKTEVVYVSPLKALSADVQKNLEEPLAEMRAIAEKMGVPLQEIRTAVRTGDTPASERLVMAKKPPHILITTPESLYILMTSESGRKALKSTSTLILDEIHAVASAKRGSHMALTVERLCRLADAPITRIGLSATQKPIEEMARFLVGNKYISKNGTADCLIVDTGHSRQMDLEIEMPESELGPIASHELWDATIERIAEMVKEHKTTLLFVNTRRLVERVAHMLSEKLGESMVVAHHGSLSRATRKDAEQKLKKGEVKVCVATASLELGIDVGSVDLVCQIGSPRSISLLLQRVGRSGHFLGGLPKGRLFPLTRDELIECIALLRAIRQKKLDAFRIPDWPLDVLAQQMVATCACEEISENDLYEMCKAAYPYRDLPKERYDSVLDMLSEGIDRGQGRRAAHIHRDAINATLKGRRGSRLISITSGGAIPDNADYQVLLQPEGTFVGTVNEDFAVESLAGDVFLLGNASWKIRRVESGKVWVEDAQGSTPTVPFWLGEAPARTDELSAQVSELREGIDERLDTPAEAGRWVQEQSGANIEASRQAVAYIAEGKRVLGVVPTSGKIVAERFFDESGGMQLVVHSPLGGRINRAWGLALRKRFCRSFDFELQAAATDDGINLSMGPQHSAPLLDIMSLVGTKTVEGAVEQAVLASPMFGTRWRWTSSRALMLLRHSGGRKVPAPLQRMRANDLLAAVFPAQTGCQDNNPGDIEVPDHPLVFESMRDCLTEAMNVAGLKDVLKLIEDGDIQILARDTVQPSAFSHQILNAMPYAFLDDAPLEERRARAVTLSRALPTDSRDLGALNPDAIAEEADLAWPVARDADELHDMLLTLGVLPLKDVEARCKGDVKEYHAWFVALQHAGRAQKLTTGNGDIFWIATESGNLAKAAYPAATLEPSSNFKIKGEPPEQEEALITLVKNRAESIGPFTVASMADQLRLREGDARIAIAAVEVGGSVMRGHFTAGVHEDEFCNRRVLERIHRGTMARLRKEIEPVPPATFIDFLFHWQNAYHTTRITGEAGVAEVIDKLQGFEAPAIAWESEILPQRVADYAPLMLDKLSLTGEIVWGRFSRRRQPADDAAFKALTRTASLSLAVREDLRWLLDATPKDAHLSGDAKTILKILTEKGATFIPDLIATSRILPVQVEDALRELIAAGYISADGFTALRRLLSPLAKRSTHVSRFHRRLRDHAGGRWFLLDAGEPTDDALEQRAVQLLRRYGIVFWEMLAREPMAPRWRDLLYAYRRMEARGEIRGGRFVASYIGEQFALPEAVEALRKLKRDKNEPQMVEISACDPLNIVGILTPGHRVPSIFGNKIAFKAGVPILSLEGGELRVITQADEQTMAQAKRLMEPRLSLVG